MPRYDYKCLKCDKLYEIQHKITEEPEIICPVCSFTCFRQISKNVLFETSGDLEWSGDPSKMGNDIKRKYSKLKKRKYKW